VRVWAAAAPMNRTWLAAGKQKHSVLVRLLQLFCLDPSLHYICCVVVYSLDTCAETYTNTVCLLAGLLVGGGGLQAFCVVYVLGAWQGFCNDSRSTPLIICTLLYTDKGCSWPAGTPHAKHRHLLCSPLFCSGSCSTALCVSGLVAGGGGLQEVWCSIHCVRALQHNANGSVHTCNHPAVLVLVCVPSGGVVV
jgi:hypothetical protein